MSKPVEAIRIAANLLRDCKRNIGANALVGLADKQEAIDAATAKLVEAVNKSLAAKHGCLCNECNAMRAALAELKEASK